MDVKIRTATEYHWQPHRQMERSNETNISGLSKYVSGYQKDSDAFVFSLTYMYNVRVH